MKRIPTIGVLVISDNKVLLVKHTEKAAHLTGFYGLPAGRLESNETEIEGAIRELKEETGLNVERKDLIHMPDIFYADIPRKGGKIAKMKWDVFVARKYSGQLKKSEETIPEWVEFKSLSKLKLIVNTETAIQKGLELLKNES